MQNDKVKSENLVNPFLNLTLYFLIFIFNFNISSPVLYARTSWQSNKLREAKKEEAIRAQIDEIPLYEEKLEGAYDILGPVYAQDMLTKKKDALYTQLRTKAYLMGADAIMEVKCKPLLKTIFVSCEGFAIKYRSD